MSLYSWRIFYAVIKYIKQWILLIEFNPKYEDSYTHFFNALTDAFELYSVDILIMDRWNSNFSYPLLSTFFSNHVKAISTQLQKSSLNFTCQIEL